jgi:pilus assembly protein CpaC
MGNQTDRGARRPSWSAALGAIALLFAALPGLAPAAQARETELSASRGTATVRISIGKSESVRTEGGFSEVIVSDPEVADAIPLTDRSLSILGKKIGNARVSVYGDGKKLVGVFDIEVSYDTTRLGSELAQRFPHARFRVSSVNGRIMVAGTSPDAVTVDKAMAVAKQFGSDVINSVRVSAPQQVMLEVRFVEASRTASRELGVNWQGVQQRLLSANNGVALTTGLANPISGAEPFGTLLGSMLGNGIQADVLVRALEERGIIRRLAEPNLVALSGDTASFLAGGEFPIPVSSNLGNVTIEFKKFGVGLAFTPTVLGDGVINLKIEPEVSQIDPTTSISAGLVTVPALIVRRANTTVELRDGQSFVLGGLLQNKSTTAQQQLPWLGDIPVLGHLFKTTSKQDNKDELLIFVTPRILREGASLY